MQSAFFERGDDCLSFRADAVLRAEEAAHALSVAYQHRCLPLAFGCQGFLTQSGGHLMFRIKQWQAADRGKLPIHVALLPFTIERFQLLSRSVAGLQVAFVRGAHHRLPQRVRAVIFQRACQRQQVGARLTLLSAFAIDGFDGPDDRFAEGQRAGLVKRCQFGLAKRLKVHAALKNHASPGRARQPADDGYRRADHQRAGAANHQQRKRAVQPAVPCRAVP